MADSVVQVSAGSGTNIDTRTESTNSHHRQVVVLGDPVINANVAAVLTQDGLTTDETTPAIAIRSVGSLAVTLAGATGTVGVYLTGTGGTVWVKQDPDGTLGAIRQPLPSGTNDLGNIIRVKNLVDGTLTTVSAVTSITNALPSGGNDLGNIIRVKNLIDGTISTVSAVTSITNALPTGGNDLGNIVRVKNLVDGTISTVTTVAAVTSITNALPVGGNDLGNIVRVKNLVDGTISTVSAVTNITNSIAVHLLSTNGTLGVNVGTIAGTTAVYLHSTAGTLNVALKPGAILTNSGHTAEIFSVSGSTSGGTTSGVTLVAPSAAYNFKIFAYSIQTTGAVSMVPRFTNGGESATEFWRPLVTASGVTGAQGANLAVTPPGFIFATGTNTTLALRNDTASLVHYSVSYIKESA